MFSQKNFVVTCMQHCTSHPDPGSEGSRHQGHSVSSDLVKVSIKVRPNLDMNLILDNSRGWTLNLLKQCIPVVYKHYVLCSITKFSFLILPCSTMSKHWSWGYFITDNQLFRNNNSYKNAWCLACLNHHKDQLQESDIISTAVSGILKIGHKHRYDSECYIQVVCNIPSHTYVYGQF